MYRLLHYLYVCDVFSPGFECALFFIFFLILYLLLNFFFVHRKAMNRSGRFSFQVWSWADAGIGLASRTDRPTDLFGAWLCGLLADHPPPSCAICISGGTFWMPDLPLFYICLPPSFPPYVVLVIRCSFTFFPFARCFSCYCFISWHACAAKWQ